MLTKREKLIILATLEDKAFEGLSEAEASSSEVQALISAVHAVRQTAELVAYTDDLAKMLDALNEAEEQAPGQVTFDDVAPITPAATAEAKENTEAVDAAPTAKAETAPIVSKAETAPVVSKAEMRTALSKLSGKGADIPAVLQQMGYTKLSEVPTEKYAELLAKAEEAV